MNLKAICSQGFLLLLVGFLLGNLEWLLCANYYLTNEFRNQSFRTACLIFVLAQPAFYWFMYTLYCVNHPDCRDNKERFKKLALGPVYAALQQTKILATFDGVYRWFEELFEMREPFHLLTIENCFKVQVFLELTLSTLP